MFGYVLKYLFLQHRLKWVWAMASAYEETVREYLGEQGLGDSPIGVIGDEEELGRAICRHRVAVVLFSSPTCPACAAYRPIFYRYAAEARRKMGNDTIGFYEANVYDLLEKAWELGITATPTTIVFKNCKPVDAVVGLVDEDTLAYIIGQYLG